MRELRGAVVRLAFLIAAVCLAGVSPPLIGPAVAEAGTGCCADLEARVAELEATSTRKGGRVMSLQLYGQVNRALMLWDDGFGQNAYVVDNDTSSTRLGMIGSAQIQQGWFTGFRIEMDLQDAASDTVYNGPGGDEGPAAQQDIQIRHAYWYVESERLGRVSLGQQSPATDDITIINLGAQMSDAALHYNNQFGLRLNLAFGLTTDLTWAHFAHTVDSLRGDFVRYDSPAIGGFVLSAAVGEDDVWDVALRYRADWDAIQVAAGVGYMDSREAEFSDVRGSASAIHKSTGLFVSAAGGLRADESGIIGDGTDAHFYFGQLGVKRRMLPYGATTIYGEAGIYNDYTVGRMVQADLGIDGRYETWGRIMDSQVRRWGFGVEQAFDAAQLLLYAQYHQYEASIDGVPCGETCNQLSSEVESLPVEPWSAIVFGARIQF